MLTKIQKSVQSLILTFKGAINYHTAENIEFLVRRRVFGNRSADTIIFDFKEVTSIDKKGAEHLRNIAEFVQKLNKKIHLVQLTVTNQSMLQHEEVSPLYNIQKTIQEVLSKRNQAVTNASYHVIDGSLGKRKGLMNS